nr:toxin C-terminal domain-containing protein [Planomonospora venezuelensis]
MPAETLKYGHDALGFATTLTGLRPYVLDSRYAPTGETLQYTLALSAQSRKIWQTFTYEEGTRRLQRSYLTRETFTGRDADIGYSYDPSGNITKIADTPTIAGAAADVQCFRYDYLNRIAEEWTPASTADNTCAAVPSQALIGGAAPYWNTYSYDLTGNRTTEVQHTTAGDVTRTYSYPAAGSAQPHALRQVATTGPNGASTDTYVYDASGNTTGRTTGGRQQKLDWDAEGHLASVTEGSAVTGYLYDADGNRLIRREASGTTLYLPDGSELKLDAAGIIKGTRYYNHNGATVAVRQAGTVQYLMADHHGTAQIAINGSTLATTTRRFTTFGAPRGTVPTNWMGERGFIGGTQDASTGLTHLGAREYDPAIGRFISVDPLHGTLEGPQSLNAYTYGINNPVNNADPTGKCVPGDCPQRTNGLYRLAAKTTDSATKQKYIEAAQKSEEDEAARYTRINSGTAKSAGSSAVSSYSSSSSSSSGSSSSTGSTKSTVMGFLDGVSDAMGLLFGNPASACGFGIRMPGHICSIHTSRIETQGKILGYSTKSKAYRQGASNGQNFVIDLGTRGAGRLLKRGAKAVTNWFKKSCKSSFVPGTLVLMADGTRKPIEDIEIGDEVLATNPETGETESKTVTALINSSGVKNLIEITIGARDSGNDIVATDSHPFWVPAVREWVEADQLQPGMWLQTPAGTRVQITAIKKWTTTQRVHNLTIADLHTYYVVEGTTPLLVHNDNCNINKVSLEQAEKLASHLGYTNTRKRSAAKTHIWENKKANPRYITWDRNGHKGGIFKGANFKDPFRSTKDSARDGTYDLDYSNGKLRGLKWIAK